MTKRPLAVALLSGSALGAVTTSALAISVGFVVSVIQRTLESNALQLATLLFAYLAIAGGIAALLVATTLGLAWHAIAHRFNWTRSHAYWLPATIVGVLLPTLIAVLPNWGATFEAESNVGAALAPVVCPFGAALGGLTSYFFWLIRRPDRDEPNPASTAS